MSGRGGRRKRRRRISGKLERRSGKDAREQSEDRRRWQDWKLKRILEADFQSILRLHKKVPQISSSLPRETIAPLTATGRVIITATMCSPLQPDHRDWDLPPPLSLPHSLLSQELGRALSRVHRAVCHLLLPLLHLIPILILVLLLALQPRHK